MWSIIKKTADVCGAAFGLWLIFSTGVEIGRNQKEREYEAELNAQEQRVANLKNDSKSRIKCNGNVLTIDLSEIVK